MAHPNHQRPLQWMPPMMLQPNEPVSSNFWTTSNVKNRYRQLRDTLLIAKAMKELEMLATLESKTSSTDSTDLEDSVCELSRFVDESMFADRQLLFVQAANSVISMLRYELEPFRVVADEADPWEEKSVAVRLNDKLKKAKRNKMWRKRKRKRLADIRAKERENFDREDQAADEWRAREIANDIAKRKSHTRTLDRT